MIVYPLSPKPGKVVNLAIIVTIWLVSCIIALPALIFSKEVLIRRYKGL